VVRVHSTEETATEPGPFRLSLLLQSDGVTASLFAYLLLNRHRVCDREELMSALWPRARLKQAGQNLYNAIFQLKKTLSLGLRHVGLPLLSRGPLIVHQERGYRLVPAESFGVDAEEFQASWRSASKETRPEKITVNDDHFVECHFATDSELRKQFVR
jgi:DNA-binding SARP family transcriptional activator